MELIKVTTAPVPGRTIGEANGTMSLAAGENLEIAHWSPGKVVDLSEAPPEGKQWFVTISVHVVETNA